MEKKEPGGKIVVGVDGSVGSRVATAWALDEAARRDAEVETVFAWALPTLAYSAPGYVQPEPKEIEAEGEELLAQTLALVSATTHVKVHSRVCDGRPVEALRRVAEEPDVRLLVVGSRGHGDLAELVLGSVSHALSHRSPKPLVIVPQPAPGPAAAARKGRIVVGVDGSPTADAALKWAAEEALIRDATLEVVVAWTVSRAVFPTRFPIPRSVELGLHKAAQEIADDALALIDLPIGRVEAQVRRGGASSVLIQRAGVADLLVVGRRGLNRAQEALLGSVSHACAHHSPVPIAIVAH
jgi:nucleotide-binding universal stress UspA family protein